MLNVIDEFTHECLAIRVDRKLKAIDVIDVLSDLFILRGVPGHIRSDNGPEFVAKAVQEWIAAVGAKTAYIAPGSPWENGYVESFNAQPARRAARRRDLLHAAGGPDRHRELAAPLQHRSAACLARLQATSTGGVRACLRRVAGCATPTGSAGHASAGAETVPKLTFQLDHSMGADHRVGPPSWWGATRMPTSSSAPGENSNSCAPGLAASSVTFSRKIEGDPALEDRFGPLLDLAHRVRHQEQRQRGPKVYSLHAPEVECIGKGKARAPYEFGCKVSIATPATAPKGGQFVLHAKALHGNPYDGHTLGPVIADLEKLTGVAVAPHPRRQGLSRPQLSRPVQGLDQRPGPPRHQSHPPRDAASRRRRARDRPSQGRPPDAPQPSQGPRRRPHQRRSRRRRLQLQPAPALVRGAFARPVIDPLSQPFAANLA